MVGGSFSGGATKKFALNFIDMALRGFKINYTMCKKISIRGFPMH